jgi:hypothetical protein
MHKIKVKRTSGPDVISRTTTKKKSSQKHRMRQKVRRVGVISVTFKGRACHILSQKWTSLPLWLLTMPIKQASLIKS